VDPFQRLSRHAPLRHPGGAVVAVRFSPDGRRGATAGRDDTVRLWDPFTGDPIGESLRHLDSPYALAFSPNGKLLVSGGADARGLLWHGDTGRPVMGDLVRDYVRDNLRWSFAWEFAAPLGAASAGTLNALPLLSLTTRFNPILDFRKRAIVRGEKSPYALTLNHDRGKRFSPPNGSRITFGSPIGAEEPLWGPGRGLRSGKGDPSDSAVNALTFSPDGKTILTGTSDRQVVLWDAATAQRVREFRMPGDETGFHLPEYRRRAVFAVAFSPDGKHVAAGCREGGVWIWAAATGDRVAGPLAHEGPVVALAGSLWTRASGRKPSTT
jgi:WD40 repeat protein